MKTRAEAFALLHDYCTNPGLIKHGLAVEACMKWYAKHFGVDAAELETWAITGLIHDFDYEKYPEPVAPDGHPYKGESILKELGYDENIRRAIMGHGTYTGVPRDTQMAKTLFAVDELSGLITASALVRPDKSILMLEAKSVLKKMKTKGFAAGCNREEIRQGAEELSVELEAHIGNCILAMREVAKELELGGIGA